MSSKWNMVLIIAMAGLLIIILILLIIKSGSDDGVVVNKVVQGQRYYIDVRVEVSEGDYNNVVVGDECVIGD